MGAESVSIQPIIVQNRTIVKVIFHRRIFLTFYNFIYIIISVTLIDFIERGSLMTKHSKQRDAILEYLHSTTSHPTADTVYENVRERLPNISLGTVYRNLNLLAESGEILRLSCGGTSDRYDGTATPHYHFLCTCCGEVSDLEMTGLEHINVIAGAGFSGIIEGHVAYFYGLCPKCASVGTGERLTVN